MSILLWIILGGIAGWLASMLLGTDARQGAVGNIVLGIVGALAGGLVMNLLGASGVNGFNLYSLLVAIVGAVVVVWASRLVTR